MAVVYAHAPDGHDFSNSSAAYLIATSIRLNSESQSFPRSVNLMRVWHAI